MDGGKDAGAMKTIAIVGGGATGLAVIQALESIITDLREEARLRITLIEKSENIGSGLAYSTKEPGHIMNMSSDIMSFSMRDNLDFLKWITEKKNDRNVISKYGKFDPYYPPRYLYGEYLYEFAYRLTGENNKRSIEVEVANDEVISIVENGNGFQLELKNNRRIDADKVVLALGNQPCSNYLNSISHPRYASSPWDADFVKNIPDEHEVYILGSSLTAIDAARSLIGKGHKGKMYFLSRRGLLPRVQNRRGNVNISTEIVGRLREMMESPEKELTWKSIFRLMLDEVKEAGATTPWRIHRRPLSSPLQRLRHDIMVAESEDGAAWQAVLCATSDIVEEVWNAMDMGERRKFDRKLLSIWMTNRHCMPLPNAHFILGLLETGVLEVLSASDSVDYDENRKEFDIQGILGKSDSNWVINATGAGTDITRTDSMLMKQLMSMDLISSHPLGGINVEFDSFMALKASGDKSNNLYAVGPLTRGVHFFTNALERNVIHSKRVARQLLETA